ncbi:PAAR domain-containing protein [Bradyrhizobium prioriisuperbiae]|uniref:PAAR domain-containing protein n=1 Tax=Bradyrhizobium prioriisuperbiae TaxID=2854389 RepID=UPI0028E379C8|nr:PAAR domain-containing protein [Bradyrhizobium prioritasuperba]
MPPAARLTDFHQCPLSTPMAPTPIPHVGGPIAGPGAPTVLIGGLPAAKVGDLAICIGPPDAVIKGSTTVTIMGMPAARMGDKTAHGGTIMLGFPTVMIGG